MPVVTVHGIPEEFQDTEELEDLVLRKIPEAIASVTELGFTTNQAATYAPRDLIQKGLGDEIIGFIDSSRFPPGLEGNRLQFEVCNRVAIVLKEFATQQGIDWHYIEVMPRVLPPVRAEYKR